MDEPTLPNENLFDEPDARGIGDNGPPDTPPYDQAVLDNLSKKTDAFLSVSNQWLKVEVTTEALAEQLTDQINGLRKVYKAIEDARSEYKAPHLQRGRDVDTAFNSLKTLIDESAGKLKPRLAAYVAKRVAEAEANRQEEITKAKRAEDEARQKAFDAAQSEKIEDQIEAKEAAKAAEKQVKAAAKPVSTAVKSATGGGRTMSQRKRKVCEITNIRALFLHMQAHQEVCDVLQRLANAEANTAGFTIKDKIPGTIITETTSIA